MNVNQPWLILNGSILNRILRTKKASLISVLHVLSVWRSSIHFPTKLLQSWLKTFTELSTWWQQSPSIFKRCGALSLSCFLQPPSYHAYSSCRSVRSVLQQDWKNRILPPEMYCWTITSPMTKLLVKNKR